jgi:acyl carrier protein
MQDNPETTGTDVEQRVRQFIIDNLRWFGSPTTLTSEYPLIDNDVLDSMAMFEMITFIEDGFGIQIGDDELVPENFETITAIARLVLGKVERMR